MIPNTYHCFCARFWLQYYGSLVNYTFATGTQTSTYSTWKPMHSGPWLLSSILLLEPVGNYECYLAYNT